MKLLDTLMLEGELLEMEKTFTVMFENYKTLVEGVTDLTSAPNDIMGLFDEASKRLDAAKRGLGLTNRLPQGEERSQHRSRIMGNLNRIRALLDRIIKSADSNNFALGQSQRFDQNRNTSV